MIIAFSMDGWMDGCEALLITEILAEIHDSTTPQETERKSSLLGGDENASRMQKLGDPRCKKPNELEPTCANLRSDIWVVATKE